jgi:hypothetical protein
MKKARLSVKIIVLNDIHHCSWDRVGKHVHTKTRYRVWHNFHHAFDDQYMYDIIDAIRKKS